MGVIKLRDSRLYVNLHTTPEWIANTLMLLLINVMLTIVLNMSDNIVLLKQTFTCDVIH